MKRYFEEINRNKYLTIVPTNESKEKIKKELGIKMRDLIRPITKKLDDYDEKYMKIKFNWDDNLPLDKIIDHKSLLIVVITHRFS